MPDLRRSRLFKPVGWLQTVAWKAIMSVGLPVALGLALALGIALHFARPAPPRQVVLAAGPQGGAYHDFAERYARVLAREGIRVEIRATAGARQNYKLLREGTEGVDAAFVRSGIGSVEEAPELQSLGAVAYEALWVFCRSRRVLDDLPGLQGKRIAIGAKGAGTRRLVRNLLAANGIGERDFEALEIGGLEAAEALFAGAADCAFLFEPPEAGLLKALIYDPRVNLVDFSRRADAYTRRIAGLHRVVLPEGMNDLEQNLPDRPITLLAAETEVLVRQDLHPAIQMLLLQAASEVHRNAGVFQSEREFPAQRADEFPLSEDARRFHTSGRPFLQRYLPFWLANLVDRAIVFLLPAIAIVLPLVRILPPLYAWSVRRRIYRWYGELMFIENEIRRTLTQGETREYEERLAWIEQEVNQLQPPLAFANQVYALRQHVDFVQHKLAGSPGEKAPPPMPDLAGDAVA